MSLSISTSQDVTMAADSNAASRDDADCDIPPEPEETTATTRDALAAPSSPAATRPSPLAMVDFVPSKRIRSGLEAPEELAVRNKPAVFLHAPTPSAPVSSTLADLAPSPAVASEAVHHHLAQHLLGEHHPHHLHHSSSSSASASPLSSAGPHHQPTVLRSCLSSRSCSPPSSRPLSRRLSSAGSVPSTASSAAGGNSYPSSATSSCVRFARCTNAHVFPTHSSIDYDRSPIVPSDDAGLLAMPARSKSEEDECWIKCRANSSAKKAAAGQSVGLSTAKPQHKSSPLASSPDHHASAASPSSSSPAPAPPSSSAVEQGPVVMATASMNAVEGVNGLVARDKSAYFVGDEEHPRSPCRRAGSSTASSSAVLEYGSSSSALEDGSSTSALTTDDEQDVSVTNGPDAEQEQHRRLLFERMYRDRAQDDDDDDDEAPADRPDDDGDDDGDDDDDDRDDVREWTLRQQYVTQPGALDITLLHKSLSSFAAERSAEDERQQRLQRARGSTTTLRPLALDDVDEIMVDGASYGRALESALEEENEQRAAAAAAAAAAVSSSDAGVVTGESSVSGEDAEYETSSIMSVSVGSDRASSAPVAHVTGVELDMEAVQDDHDDDDQAVEDDGDDNDEDDEMRDEDDADATAQNEAAVAAAAAEATSDRAPSSADRRPSVSSTASSTSALATPDSEAYAGPPSSSPASTTSGSPAKQDTAAGGSPACRGEPKKRGARYGICSLGKYTRKEIFSSFDSFGGF